MRVSSIPAGMMRRFQHAGADPGNIDARFIVPHCGGASGKIDSRALDARDASDAPLHAGHAQFGQQLVHFDDTCFHRALRAAASVE